MKLKKSLISVIALISLGTVGSLVNNSATTVEAKKVPTVYPKAMRGNWYFFNKEDINYPFVTKETFTKTKVTRTYYYGENPKKMKMGTDSKFLHKYIPHTATDALGSDDNKALHWEFLTGYKKEGGHKWLNIKQWNSTNAIGGHEEDGGLFYNVSKLKGHQVLTEANVMHGSKIHNCAHWYRSKKLARKWSLHEYKGFLY